MGLIDRVAAARDESRYSVDTWLDQYLIPSVESGMYGYGSGSPFGVKTTYEGQRIQEVASTLSGHMAALRSAPPAFAAQAMRARVMSQARFTFRNRRTREPFGSDALRLLERPWPNGTAADLVSRMEWHAGIAGSAYVLRDVGRLRVLRPDWCGVLYGSAREAKDADGSLTGFMTDATLIGYVYQAGGIGQGRAEPQFLGPTEVCHWSPMDDPEAPGEAGMSWLTPAIRDIQGDKAASTHKLQFFANSATPNMVVKGITAQSPEKFNELVDMLEERHAGLGNAYKTLYLTAGADASVVGANLRQIDFAATQASGEARITMLSGVPASLLGISKGLEGSSLNAGNFAAARRGFGDTWVRPMLANACSALSSITDVPGGAELWFDTTDISLLHEDAKDAAEVLAVQAQAIRTLTDGGYEPDTVVAGVTGGDLSGIAHTGMLPVQVQPPGTKQSGAAE